MPPAPPTIDWTSVVDGNRDWIERLIIARTGSASGVDDLLQEVGLAVAQSAARPTQPDEVAPWLCTIVVRQCALFVRNQARQRRKMDGLHQDRLSQPAPAADPIFWLLHEERKDILRSELAALEASSRQLLVWKYVQGLRYEDIATRLGITRHIAEYRVIEARKQLRLRLLARGIDDA